MREYGQVQCAFWQSDLGQLSDDAKLLALYLMTGPHSNGSGCYPCPIEYVMGDLRWPSERVMKGFEELSRYGFSYRFGTVVFIRKYLAWNPVANANVALARMKEFRALPSGDGKALLAMAILKYCKHFSADFRAELETVAGTVTETVSQTVWQTRSYPIRPDPDPTQTRSDHTQRARESTEGQGDDPRGTDTLRVRATLPPDFEQFLDETYPDTAHGRNVVDGVHRAQGLVGGGLITEALLRTRLTGFRAFVDTGGYSGRDKVPSLSSWLDRHHPKQFWARDWAAVPTKAEQQVSDVIEAGQEWLRKSGASA